MGQPILDSYVIFTQRGTKYLPSIHSNRVILYKKLHEGQNQVVHTSSESTCILITDNNLQY